MKKTEKIHYKHVLLPDEIGELGKTVARLTGTINDIQDEAKSVAGTYKSKVQSAEIDRNSAANKINNGYEYRETMAKVDMDYVRGIKHYYHPETLEYLKQEPMTAEDRQTEMKLQATETTDDVPVADDF